MATFLRTAGMILLLGGLSPALAGIAWTETRHVAVERPVIICHIGPPGGGTAGRIHWPPEFHARKAPAYR